MHCSACPYNLPLRTIFQFEIPMGAYLFPRAFKLFTRCITAQCSRFDTCTSHNGLIVLVLACSLKDRPFSADYLSAAICILRITKKECLLPNKISSFYFLLFVISIVIGIIGDSCRRHIIPPSSLGCHESCDIADPMELLLLLSWLA